jgi:hypothetical protein
MRRKVNEAESAALLWLLVIGTILGLVVKVAESMGWGVFISAIILVLGFCFWIERKKQADRVKYLRNKYQNEDLVSQILNGRFWQGQTSEQLIDSIGQPVGIDEKHLKTKHKQIWKYNRRGQNRFGLRITLENGIVIGWDQKAS